MGSPSGAGDAAGAVADGAAVVAPSRFSKQGKTLSGMDGFTWGGSHCDGNSGLGIARPLGEVDATPRLGRGVVWLATSGICIGADRPSFGAGVAVGRSGTHLAFRPLEFPPHASVAAWLHWLCWP